MNTLAANGLLGTSVPTWVALGTLIATALTLAMLFVRWGTTIIVTSVSGDVEASEPQRSRPGATLKAFTLFGVPVGLPSGYIWSHNNPWVGVAAGIVVATTIWILMLRINKTKRH